MVVGTSSSVSLDRGTSAHTFSNPGSTSLRMLVMVRPAGAETFFQEMSEMIPAGMPPDVAKLTALAQRYDIEILGPPLAMLST